jgi:CHAT domain-containing protein
MTLRSLAGLAALAAVALCLGVLWAGPGEVSPAPDDGDDSASYRLLGVRLPAAGAGNRAAPGALGFGPIPSLDDLPGPGRRAVQALAEGRYDAAIFELERALEIEPDDRPLTETLAAAFLASGLDPDRDRPTDLAEALELLGRRPTDPASLFNRALALEGLYCFRLAARAWERYLEVDPGSEWGAIARERLDGARAVIARLDTPAHPEGEAERDGGEAPASASSPEHAAALGALREGLDALDAFRIDRAAEALDRSLPVLEAAGDPRRWEAEEGLARVEYHRDLVDRSESRALRVLAAARTTGDVALQNRSLWILANLNLGRLSLQPALDYARQRYDLALETGDQPKVASAAYSISRILDEIGEPDEAWSYRMKAFRSLADLGDGFNLALSVQNSSFALARQGKLAAAADFVSEMLELDREADDAFRLVQSLWMRASHLAQAGDSAGAFADLEEASSRLDEVEDDGLRAYFGWRLRVVEGVLLAQSDPGEAVEAFSLALASSARTESEYWEAEILLERARALRLAGRPQEAGRDLAEAVRLVSSQRSRIGQPLLRVSFFNLQSELADEAVAGAVALGRADEAFRLAESMKGILLRESLGSSDLAEAALAPAAPGWRPALRFGDVLVSYWSLPEELLIWTARPDHPLALHRQPVSRRALSTLLRRFGDRARTGQAAGALSAQAYRLLLAPVAEHLAGARRLIVVPDRSTRGVPWAALRESSHGPAILDSLVVRLRPTAQGAGDPARVHSAPLTAGKLLALGDPWTNGELPALPGARAEVFEAARRFPEATVLVGREATRSRLLGALPHADAVQIASHFTTGKDPWSTRIVLAAEDAGGEDGLAVREIVGLDLGRTRLVVLSGCATGREGTASLEGTFAAAGAFLAAGAEEVVATLWPVDDRTTMEIMRALYDRLEAGYETDEALREAQRALAEARGGAAREGDWAAFQVLSMEPPREAAQTTKGGGS